MDEIVGYESAPTDVAGKLDVLVQTGLLLARETDLDKVIHTAIHAGLRVSTADCGAFLKYDRGRAVLYTLTAEDTLVQAPLHEVPEFLAPSAPECIERKRGDRIPAGWRLFGSASVTIRGYLIVPVVSATGEVLGRLIYGYSHAHAFHAESEKLVETISAQAAIAIQAAILREQNRRQVEELQRAELRLEEAVKRRGELAAIVESSDDAIISKDLTGRILTWNAAASRILGFAEHEIVGRSILTLIPDELQDEEQTILSKIRSGERIDHYETVRLTKNGQRLDVSLSISPVRDGSGRVIGASKILRDVTQRKRMEASLLEAEKISATGRMAATIAHEINNPLEAVVNLLYLARSAPTLEQSNEYVSAAEAEVSRVSHIARQTLGFYRDNASAKYTDISGLAADALKIYGPRCQAIGIAVERNLQSHRGIVVRHGEILQVLSNLIANAIQAMPDGGILKISVEDAEEPCGVIIRVADTGTGIEHEQLPHIFDAFFTTRGSIGTGIGLFVANQLIVAHGGSIKVDTSTLPQNHGTTMSIFLPLITPYTPRLH